MNSSMRILYLEDNPVDVELSRAVLEKDGLKYEMTVVDTREDYVAALEAGGYDLILADYHLPSFDGMGLWKSRGRSIRGYPSSSFQA